MLAAYASLADYQAFHKGEEIPEIYLYRASREVDVLTFNRIVAVGFDNLTEYQKWTVKEAVCEHASFIYENEDLIETYLSSYAINGVSMSFGESWNLKVQDGVAIKESLYRRLVSTNLCWKGGI